MECRKGGRETFLKNDPQTVTGDFNISFSLQYKSPVSIASRPIIRHNLKAGLHLQRSRSRYLRNAEQYDQVEIKLV